MTNMDIEATVDPADLYGIVAWRREALGKSQNQLGAESGTGQSAISRMEAGSVDVRLGTLIEVARALGMDVRVVPREVLRPVDDMIRGVTSQGEDGPGEQPLYRLEDDDVRGR